MQHTQITKNRSLYRCLLTVIVACLFTSAQASAKRVAVKTGLATPVMQANQEQTAFLRVSLTGFEIDKSHDRAPLNVALVLDQSSSMQGDKIERAKDAAILAVSKLAADDIVSIVTYDTVVNVLVPAGKAKDKQALYRAIQNIRANGSTALFAGTSKGADEVSKYLQRERVNRVVLLSDGMANVGPDSPSELGELGRALAKKGMSVSTIGLGLGYNEDLMTQLASYSDGNHDFVQNSADLARVFDREFGDAMSVVAQDVQIEIICEDGVVPLRIIGRDGTIIGNRVKTRVNQLYSSQENYVVLEVKVPASREGTQRDLANVKVRYNNMVSKQADTATEVVVARFSDDEKVVQGAIDKPAYEAAVEQVANETTKRALELRDQGDVAAAQQTLSENASFLGRAAKKISSDKLERQSEESLEEAAVVAEPEWNKSRKELKAKTYKRARQQEKKDQ